MSEAKARSGAEQTMLDELDALDVPRTSGPSPELLEIAKRTVAKIKADAKSNGRTAQRNREIDRERREEGRDDYALKRRVEYHAVIQETEGRLVRAYGEPDSEAKRERRLAQNAAAKLKHKTTRTSEQIEEDRRKDRERKRAARGAKP